MSVGDVVRAVEDDIPPWLRKLVWLMDDAVRIPGTKQGVGLDALLGAALPGAGDALTGLTTIALVYVAWKKGVPGAVIARMVMQQALDYGIGTIPVVGDVFDVFNRANKRNLELIEKHEHRAAAPTWKDRAWVALALLIATSLVALPLAVAFYVVSRAVAYLRGD